MALAIRASVYSMTIHSQPMKANSMKLKFPDNCCAITTMSGSAFLKLSLKSLGRSDRSPPLIAGNRRHQQETDADEDGQFGERS